MATIDVRRAGDRLLSETGWWISRHSFSYGGQYQPDNTSFGLLLAHNDDVLAPGAGFDEHPHRELEIVTWVLEGSLRHADGTGRQEELRPGQVQVFGTGAGSTHSEHAGPAGARYVQMWLVPGAAGLPVSYARADLAARPGEWTPVASGLARHAGSGAAALRQPAAGFAVARVLPGRTVELPAAAYLHVFVVAGPVRLAATRLDPGDAARITDATEPIGIRAGDTGALVGVWEMHDAVW